MGTACYNRMYLERQAVAVAAEVVILEGISCEGRRSCNVALHRARQVQLRELHAARGVLPRCCGNLDENWLAFTLEFALFLVPNLSCCWLL